MNILSFDIEPWFLSYESSDIDIRKWDQLDSRIELSLSRILNFLADHKVKGTFYIMGWVAERHPDVVQRIAAEGHELGYHSYYHQTPAKLGSDAFEDDLARGLGLLRKIVGSDVEHYRAPRFSLDENTAWCIPILLKHGIRISSSAKSLRTAGNKKIPQTPFYFEFEGQRLLELPLNQVSTFGIHWVFTGSGYFRILPLRLIEYLYNKHDYNMAYFHPRDFDIEVPKLKELPFYRNIMSRLGNYSTIPKLSYLLQKEAFITVGEAAARVLKKADPLPVISLD